MNFLDKISVKNRLIALIILTGLTLMIFSGAIFSWKTQKDLYAQKQKQIEYITEMALTLVKEYKQRVNSGELTLEDSQKRAKERISKLRYDKNNYIWINTYDGTMLVHPANPELIGSDFNLSTDKKTGKKFVTEMIKDVKADGFAINQYYWTKQGKGEAVFPKISVARGFADWQWMIATGVYIDDIQQEIVNSITIVLGICTALLIIICFIAYFTIGRSIINPIQKITGLSLKLANNDLTVDIPDDDTQTEIGELNRSFKKFVNNLKHLIGDLAKSVEDISASSQEMNASADQTAQGSQQTANSTAQLAQGANEISSNITIGATTIGNMNKVIQGISEEAKIVAKLGNDSEVNANEGSKHVQNAVGKIDNIKTVAGDISITVSKLGKLSSEIETIVDLIKGIAGQTNLLALNAAIEAARAGEHGKGFAVVAEEVKKLAGQSAEATDKITGMIKEIQSETGIAVTKMDKATNEVEEGVTIVNEAGKALDNIIFQVKQANTKIQGITKEIEGVANNSEEVVKMVENISAVTEETAASAEEISSITEEQTASLQEISASSQTLAQIAENLNRQVSVFKI